MVVSTDGLKAITGDLSLISNDSDIILKLGDAVGIQKFVIKDSNNTDIFSVNSDGLTDTSQAIILGNTSNLTAGTIRWTGSDFEGYNGSSWVSLTTSSSDIAYIYIFRIFGYLRVITDLDATPFENCTINNITMLRQYAGTSGSTIIDINKNGTTLFTTQSNRPQVIYSAGNNAVDTTVPDITSIANGDVITIDIDQVEGGEPKHIFVGIKVNGIS